MRILDRYILTSFLVPFSYCFLGFIAIWLVFDFMDNSSNFIEAKASYGFIVYYYLTQVPQIVLIVLPVALLLGLLYSLSRMSRSNEIISILTSGRSLMRLILPLAGAGIAAATFAFVMNYEYAPHADTIRKSIFEILVQQRDKEKKSFMEGILFRNRADHRTWYLQIKANTHSGYLNATTFEPSNLAGVHITQQDAEGNILCKYYARGADFDPAKKLWTFKNGMTVNFDEEGNVTSKEPWETKTMEGWSETPWRIVSSNLQAQNLSVPELRDYMHYNADFPEVLLAPYRTYYYYRWAQPASCLVVVLIAAPLGIVFSRRGVLTGVASAIFIFFGMIFFDKFFLALGKGDRILPAASAWAMDVIFALIGIGLLYMRSTNRDFSIPNLKNLFKSSKRA